MEYSLSFNSNYGQCSFNGENVEFVSSGAYGDAFFELEINFNEWEEDAYVLLPACAYNGNRFTRMASSYPPMYSAEQMGILPQPIITDIPALNKDGSGKINVTAGDVSVPCVGVFYRQKKQMLFVFAEQECKGRNIGFLVEKRKITIQFPSKRELAYRFCRPWERSEDLGISVKDGEKVSVTVKIKTGCCQNIPEFFEYFFKHRKDVVSDPPAKNMYSNRLWDIMEDHFNNHNWSGEYYAEISHRWQCGWVGGGMSSLALLKRGNALSKERAIKTLDFLTSNISPSGFFYGLIDKNGDILDDSFGNPHLKHAHLVRKSGDALYFLFAHFDVMTPKESWINAARRVSNAFVTLYERYGSFGQLVNDQNGEMQFGKTASGAMAIGALTRAYKFFKDSKYLEIARRAGEDYYREFVAEGITYGGPGEALCAPDSESSYGMVESLVALYEATKEDKWITYAKDAAHLFSSWVVTYSYRFPEESEFGRLGINTVGSVFANAQNKHSAPGICTFSGKALFLLYKYTGDRMYLELLYDIVLCIPQCVSTRERPIRCWSRGKEPLPEGYICERVNMSDWEGLWAVGGVFYGSCWCETSLALTFTEILDDPEIANALNFE